MTMDSVDSPIGPGQHHLRSYELLYSLRIHSVIDFRFKKTKNNNKNPNWRVDQRKKERQNREIIPKQSHPCTWYRLQCHYCQQPWRRTRSEKLDHPERMLWLRDHNQFLCCSWFLCWIFFCCKLIIRYRRSLLRVIWIQLCMFFERG